jgi:Zn-dependent peptidase ImmA (M78 family)/transcriptional regulator with XRE-family HTH domain
MKSRVYPAMITLAREARGYSQTRLSGLSGVSQAHISKIEASIIDASPEIVTVLAKAMEMPERFFSQPDEILGAGASEFFHRKRQAVPTGVLRQIHAQINIQRIHVERLLKSVEMPAGQIPQLKLRDFQGNPREAARAVRAVLHLPSGPIPNLVRVVENAGGLIIPVDFGTYEVDAISRWVPGLPPLFFVNSSAPVDRFRMNLAHELGHMVMHRVPEPDMEPQANAFASEFLMPEADIKNHLYGMNMSKLAALKPHWRTSMASILKASSDLKCITEGTARYLWIQLSSKGYRKREPVELDLQPEPPTLLREIFDFYRKDMGYSVEDLANMLAIRPKDLLAWYPFSAKAEPKRQFRIVN